jgi:hypothetical protein
MVIVLGILGMSSFLTYVLHVVLAPRVYKPFLPHNIQRATITSAERELFVKVLCAVPSGGGYVCFKHV